MRDAAWWRGATIYQIYPRSFADSNGDGVGDLPGITARLDHVARLGVDAIWLSPVFLSPQKDFGYDVADHTAIDPLFGTMEDFDALVDHAHRHGLKVLLDQVFSHTSTQHAWFRDSRRCGPMADWYVWADASEDGTPPNNWLSVFGGSAWTWEPRRRQFYLHHFLPDQPQLNLHNPAVQDALLESGPVLAGPRRRRFPAGCDRFLHARPIAGIEPAGTGRPESREAFRPAVASQRHAAPSAVRFPPANPRVDGRIPAR